MSRVAVLGLALATALAGCQTDSGSNASGPAASTAPGGSGPMDPGSTFEPPSPTQDAEAPAVLDPKLLGYLPATVGGVAVTEAPDEAALALADPALSRIATGLDVGLAVDQANGNLVTAHVVRLREGAFDDATYRQWRDTFDEGACAAAGGVEGRLEVTMAERIVHVTSCAGALRTYHVLIADEDILVSASSVGEGRFGELLLAGLRIPA